MNPATLFFTAALSALYLPASVAEAGTIAFPQYITDTVPANTTSDKPESSNIRALYETYQARLNAIGTKSDISGNGFDIVESQIFHLSRRFCSNLSQNPGWIPPQNPVMSPKRNPPQGCLSFRHLTGRTTVLRCFLPTQTAQFCTVQTSLRRTTAYAGR